MIDAHMGNSEGQNLAWTHLSHTIQAFQAVRADNIDCCFSSFEQKSDAAGVSGPELQAIEIGCFLARWKLKRSFSTEYLRVLDYFKERATRFRRVCVNAR